MPKPKGMCINEKKVRDSGCASGASVTYVVTDAPYQTPALCLHTE